MHGSRMHNYSVFGRALRSDFPLPELAPREAPLPGWTVQYLTTPPPALTGSAAIAGAETIYDGVRATLERHAHGWRITVDDTGTFDWDAASRTITCWRRPGGTDDFLRAHLLGRVLGTVLHDEGMLVLHGSAVVSPAGAVGFLAPKGYGKTSLALAMARAGASLLTDDTLALELAAGPPASLQALPGVTSARLLPDSATALGMGLRSEVRADGKQVAELPGGMAMAAAPAPLSALYLLLPATAIDGNAAAARAPLPATSALAALNAHTKVGEMLGGSARADLLRRAATVLAQVPVQGLVVTRDLSRLDEAARAILSWHHVPPSRLPAFPP